MFKIIVFLIIYYIYANTSLMFYTNSTYNIVNDINLNKDDLMVSTHSYEHIDIFILVNEYIKKKINVTIVFADNFLNKVLKYYIYSIRVNWINFLFVKGGTVNKVKEIINKEPVIIYLYDFVDHTGIYYMSKFVKNIYLCKIKSDHEATTHNKYNPYEIYMKNYKKHYKVEYSQYEYESGLNKEIFINNLKTELYN